MREVGSSYCSSSWRKLDADDTDRVPLYSRGMGASLVIWCMLISISNSCVRRCSSNVNCDVKVSDIRQNLCCVESDVLR